MPTKKFNLVWGNHCLELGERTRIMGILNITPDSFSDGGKFFALDNALAQAEKMIAAGADIIDIGGESTRPFSEAVSIEEETRRVIPVIGYLAKKISIPISIDTTKSVVARRAVSAGASIINDISALRFDPDMAEVAANNDVLLILMHMKGTPSDMQASPFYDDLMGEIKDFLAQAIVRAENSGVAKNKIIIDPGIGFGKTVQHNLFLINNLNEFQELNVPVLFGSSRKAFIRRILVQDEKTEPKPDHPLVETGTQATVAAGIIGGAHIVRVHNVSNTCATVKLIDAIRNSVLKKTQESNDASGSGCGKHPYGHRAV
ncbi:MAG: dihydropteroate synthase [Desulfobacteraceae bacterium]|nr:dihydropteroate synthase [Desulfobacteraceae bacterium]MBC2757020.1 dihydropteroate synthase [Desulfobacteraceae bacterium]